MARARRHARRVGAHGLPGPGHGLRLQPGRLRHGVPVLRHRAGRAAAQPVDRRRSSTRSGRRPRRPATARWASRRGCRTSCSWAWASRSPTTSAWSPRCAGSPTPAPDGLGISARGVTVSTVGLVPAIDKLTAEGLPVTLAVSLHAPDDELRDTLVPVNNRWKVGEVLDAARRYATTTGRRVSIEYALIRDVNDQPWRADLLGTVLRRGSAPSACTSTSSRSTRRRAASGTPRRARCRTSSCAGCRPRAWRARCATPAGGRSPRRAASSPLRGADPVGRSGQTGPVKLPVMPPVKPMLAKPVADIPPGQLYEPKWDGFRSIIFRDGDEVEIGSRNEKPMTRYFPEVVEAVLANFPERAVIDGEIIVADTARNTLDFEALQQRIHPAASRVNAARRADPGELRRLRPARPRRRRPHRAAVRQRRRAALEECLADAQPPVHVTPVTRDLDTGPAVVRRVRGRRAGRADRQAARPDLPAGQAGDGQDQAQAHGRLRGRRLPGAQVRPGRRSARCCSGLYDERGVLASVGVIGAFPMAVRRELFGRAAAAGHHVRGPPVELGRARAGRAHPAQERGQPLERRQGPVVHAAAPGAGGRGALRLHGGRAVPAHRPVRALAARTASRESCTYAQLERPVEFHLADVLTGA